MSQPENTVEFDFAEEHIACFERDDHGGIVEWLAAKGDESKGVDHYFFIESVIHIGYLLAELIDAKKELLSLNKGGINIEKITTGAFGENRN